VTWLYHHIQCLLLASIAPQTTPEIDLSQRSSQRNIRDAKGVLGFVRIVM
jgi:hypothetical protein